MSITRVALIFDNTARPETTGIYCRRALGNLVEVEHFLPTELAKIPPGEFDLYLNIDDGLRYELPAELKPSACWVIDTHLDFDWSLRKARAFDFVFAAQKDGTERLREAGVTSAEWLPLACDPEFHRPHDVPQEYDVCFVGNVFPGPRQELLELLQQRYARTFVGRRYLHAMAQAYSASAIAFNRSISDDVNMRVFEALACGSLLVTNDLTGHGLDELFQDGRHLATYRNADELLARIEYFLAHPDERREIACVGRTEVLSRHTYMHRMLDLLRYVERRLPASKWPPAAKCVPRSASACLVSWKRPDNIRLIVDRLRSEPLIDDIVVWNNNPDQPLEIDAPDVTVINSPRNVVTYARFLATRHARHDLIYTQDDDCLVHNLDQLHDTWQLDPERIAHGLKLGHLMQHSADRHGTGEVALVGWGAFFHRGLTRALDAYRQAYGEDELLHRKADRLFSLLQWRRHRAVIADVTDLPGASGPESLSVRHDHLTLSHEAIARALSLQPGMVERPVADRTGETCSTPLRDSIRGKDRTYFEFARPELLAIVPAEARRVLDIGCGCGRLGESIRRRQNTEVWGVELDPVAASEAARRLDRVVTADIEQDVPELPDHHFDVIVCGDVLEHLRAPDAFLKRCRDWLTAGGRLIASIPNVQHHTVVSALLEGNWTYQPAGLLDEDHVRFFTRREIEKLFFRAGFAIDELGFVPGEGFDAWQRAGSPREIRLGSVTLTDASAERVAGFHAYQYLVRASLRSTGASADVRGCRASDRL